MTIAGSLRFQGDQRSQLRRSLTWSYTRYIGACTVMSRLTVNSLGRNNEMRTRASRKSPTHKATLLRNFFIGGSFALKIAKNPRSEQAFDHPLLIDPFRLGLVVAHDPVTQDVLGDSPDVGDVRGVLSVDRGMALGAQHEVLRRARARAPGNVLVDLRRGARRSRPCFRYERDGVLEDVVGYRDAAHEMLEGHDILRVEDMP